MSNPLFTFDIYGQMVFLDESLSEETKQAIKKWAHAKGIKPKDRKQINTSIFEEAEIVPRESL